MEEFEFPVWAIILIAIFAFIILCIIIRKIQIKLGMFKKDTQIDGKVVIITGANTGIGKETAIDLAKRGGKIYIACRDTKRGEEALQDIIHKSGSQNVFFLKLDLASMTSIREFVKKFKEIEKSLHILINNAGVMICPKMLTEDGFEMQLGVNHLGHFLLTNLLLDTLKSSAPSRIVVVSSGAHKMGEISKTDLNSELSYNKFKAYSQSKLANVMFTIELSKILENSGVTVNCLHPGVIQTELGRYVNPYLKKYVLHPFIAVPFFQTPHEGAQTQIKLAVDPDLNDVTGKYFEYCKEKKLKPKFLNEDVHKWLWDKSMEFTKL